MATRLIQTLAFLNVPSLGSVAQLHSLNIAGVATKPDLVAFDAGGFTAVVTSTTITVTNTGPDPASVNVWLQIVHTTPREIGAIPLVPSPFVIATGGGGGTGGGGETTVFTFRPGAVSPGPYVFDDWATLYTALDTARAAQLGFFTIAMDDSVASPLIIPAGAYDLSRTGLAGIRGPTTFAPVSVEINDGASISGLMSISGLSLTKTNVPGNAPIVVPAGTVLSIEGSTLTGGSAAAPLILMGGSSLIRLGDQAFLGASSVSIGIGDTGSVFMDGGPSAIFQDAIIGDATSTLQPYVTISSAQIQSQAGMAGTITIQQFVPLWYWGLGDPNGIVSADSGFKLLDTSSVNTWVCTGGTTWAITVPRSTFPEKWVVANIPANTIASTAMSALVSTNYDTIRAIHLGSLVGIAVQLDTAITAGTLVVEATVNGVATALALSLAIGDVGGQMYAAIGAVPFVAGDQIGINFRTTADFAPTTASVEAWLTAAE